MLREVPPRARPVPRGSGSFASSARTWFFAGVISVALWFGMVPDGAAGGVFGRRDRVLHDRRGVRTLAVSRGEPRRCGSSGRVQEARDAACRPRTMSASSPLFTRPRSGWSSSTSINRTNSGLPVRARRRLSSTSTSSSRSPCRSHTRTPSGRRAPGSRPRAACARAVSRHATVRVRAAPPPPSRRRRIHQHVGSKRCDGLGLNGDASLEIARVHRRRQRRKVLREEPCFRTSGAALEPMHELNSNRSGGDLH